MSEILTCVNGHGPITFSKLKQIMAVDDQRLMKNIQTLKYYGLVSQKANTYEVTPAGKKVSGQILTERSCMNNFISILVEQTGKRVGRELTKVEKIKLTKHYEKVLNVAIKEETSKYK